MGGGLRLGRVRGTPIVLYPTAILLIVFIAYLSWPSFSRRFPTPTAVLMAVGVAVGLLFTILLHELGHVAAARIYRIHTTEVSLFGMGGMARLAAPPRSPLADVVISVAGPIVSLAVGAALYWGVPAYVSAMPGYGVTSAAVLTVLYQLGIWNLFIGVFNLLPGPPLDGGGVVRGIAWAITKDRVRSVQVSGYTGLVAAAGCGLLALSQVLGPEWMFPLIYAVMILIFGSWTAARGAAGVVAAGNAATGAAGSAQAGRARMSPQATEIAEVVERARVRRPARCRRRHRHAHPARCARIPAQPHVADPRCPRRELRQRVGGGARGDVPAGEAVPYSVPARQMVESASRSGRGRDGLLLALPENSDAAERLGELGVDVAGVKRELEAAITDAARTH